VPWYSSELSSSCAHPFFFTLLSPILALLIDFLFYPGFFRASGGTWPRSQIRQCFSTLGGQKEISIHSIHPVDKSFFVYRRIENLHYLKWLIRCDPWARRISSKNYFVRKILLSITKLILYQKAFSKFNYFSYHKKERERERLIQYGMWY